MIKFIYNRYNYLKLSHDKIIYHTMGQ